MGCQQFGVQPLSIRGFGIQVPGDGPAEALSSGTLSWSLTHMSVVSIEPSSGSALWRELRYADDNSLRPCQRS